MADGKQNTKNSLANFRQ